MSVAELSDSNDLLDWILDSTVHGDSSNDEVFYATSKRVGLGLAATRTNPGSRHGHNSWHSDTVLDTKNFLKLLIFS